uniref:Uncharacterized protein n=2 Tax=Pavlovaceae TaxID=418969 RepID=M1K3N9_DIALT|nr:hypothetical protein H907_pgp109 [Diacronema lutheri]YP_009863742.1 hypothetical protein [Pavlova sp. NIVA-4/92]AGE93721.1 hypothetical protein [Diacronema lutheri]QKE31073.1 hypothetical protein [Pavlova sp. NIVA-4/92]
MAPASLVVVSYLQFCNGGPSDHQSARHSTILPRSVTHRHDHLAPANKSFRDERLVQTSACFVFILL